ncbi:hypothetical protein CMV_023384 [Castanea mollissima]|uniref:Uncharacterized protein n=1 Tax=Castanea mollissima TaxID=60419 RepID=A0A8J4VJG7_9ROSI|nr:hypothetical protein CMV_023384 [Castanea mollissima]
MEKLFKQGRQYNNLKSINLGRLFNQFREIFRDLDCDPARLVEFVVSTNGFSKRVRAFVYPISGEHLFLCPVYLGGWNESNPSEQNHVRITVKIWPLREYCSSDDPKITWLGVHVDCICSDDIDHHSFPSDVGLQMDTTNGLDLPMGHPSLGFTYGLDDQDSSTIARICDNTEPPPLPAIFSTPYGSDLDHGVSNTGGVSGLLIDPNFESSFHDDVHDLDLTASRDGCPPLVLDDIEHHCLPSDALPVDTTNGSELGLGQQDLDSFASIGYNGSNVGEHWLLRFLKAPPFSILCQCFQ